MASIISIVHCSFAPPKPDGLHPPRRDLRNNSLSGDVSSVDLNKAQIERDGNTEQRARAECLTAA
jgi:hypothetical protein